MPFDPITEPPAAKAPRAAPVRKSLTQLFVDKLNPPAAGYVTHWDKKLPGFGVRVSPTGRNTFVAQYTVKDGTIRIGKAKGNDGKPKFRYGTDVVETIGTIDLIPKVEDARPPAYPCRRRDKA